MRRQEFMDAMRSRLSAIGKSPQEVDDILADFEEHIAAGVAGGRSEEDIVAGIGDPAELAAQYADGSEVPKPPAPPAPPPAPTPAPAVTAAGIGRGLFAAVALILFDLIVGLPVFFALLSVVLSLWAAVLALGVAGLAVTFATPFLPFTNPFSIPGVFLVFVGVALMAFTVLFAIGVYYVSKVFILGVKAYAVAHAKIVKGGSRP